MAHYDCKNCGASMGIDFGYCKNCTPKDYFEIQEEKDKLKTEAELSILEEVAEFKSDLLNKYLDKTKYRELLNKLDTMKKEAYENN